MASSLSRIFVANRGEIAVRVIRACKKLGIETVAAFSEADRDSMAPQIADKAICVGPARSSESYLRAEALVMAAKGTGCQAIHPGYGFLSERASFAALCGEAGLTFIGPSPRAIEMMGDKISAVQIATEAGVERVPGSGRLRTLDEARRFAAQTGYPVLLKASAGGGGRGMRIVRAEKDLPQAVESAAAEAQAAFGDSALYLEKFIERARHIEIQVLGDSRGNVVHLGERDCSTQRRHQKLIEEGPSPVVDEALRTKLGAAAVKLADRVGYHGVGTIEFVFDVDTRRFYFLEMNTRIQVEHPVTEMITGVDLIDEQIKVASGEDISIRQEDVVLRGHAIECRINAEDAQRNFRPSPGKLEQWKEPKGAGIRVDSHCFAGYRIPPYYDSLLGKLIVHAPDRRLAIERMCSALREFEVAGVTTTIPFHLQVLEHEDFASAKVTTRWVEETLLGNA